MYTCKSFSGIFIGGKVLGFWDYGSSLAPILGPTTAVDVFEKLLSTMNMHTIGISFERR